MQFAQGNYAGVAQSVEQNFSERGEHRMYFCEIFRFKLGIIAQLLALAVYLIAHPIMPAESYQRPAQAHKCGDGRRYTTGFL